MTKKQNILITAFIVLAICGIYMFIKTAIDNTKEVQYCGKVVKVYMTPAGYRVYPSMHVVFYCDSLNKNIDVRVTNQQFVNTIVGHQICFELNRMQLEE